MSKPQIKSAGFTLVETLLYFALVSVLLLSVTSLFVTMLETKLAANSLSQVERDSQFIQSRLAYDIRRADSIIEPATAGSSSATLRLRINGQDVSYQVNDNKLLYSAGGVTALTQTQTSIYNFSVRRLGAVGGTPTVKIYYEIVSEGSTARGPETRSYETTIGVR